ncbi:MAG: hypothetical protein OXB95_04895 [Rhodobacteraceae bacterium]|nr:hypothetical protein [Paracoccaceae bacterium]
MSSTFLQSLSSVAVAATCVLASVAPDDSRAVDSTYSRPDFDAPKTSDSSVLGRASDGMTCQYAGSTGKIDCLYSMGGEEYIVDSVSRPTYSRFGSFPFGRMSKVSGGRLGFANGESQGNARGGSGLVFCRLALQFRTADNELVWIWHDELRHVDGKQLALIDTNGDRHPDLAVNGEWNGVVHGSSRWWTPDPTSSAYASDERSYTVRPEFHAKTSRDRSRSCRPMNARLLTLVPLSSKLSGTVARKVPVWRSTSAP